MTAPSATRPPDAEQTARMLAVRRSIVNALKAELVGPAPGLPAVQTGLGDERVRGEEILRPQDSPRLRYGAGILFPQRTASTAQDAVVGDEAAELEAARATAEALAEGNARAGAGRDGGPEPRIAGPRSEADTEQEVNRANEYLPSAMGLTALVSVPDGGLRIRVRSGRYEQIELPGRGRTSEDGTYHPYMAWRRVPIEHEVLVARDVLLDPDCRPAYFRVPSGSEDVNLFVHVFSRPVAVPAVPRLDREEQVSDRRMVTITLLNRTERTGERPRDEECLFQCRFAVEALDRQPCFLDYPESARGDAEDEDSLRLLYRKRRIYAVGHGCAPEWRLASDTAADDEWSVGIAERADPDPDASSATRIWTSSVPIYEMRPILPREIPGLDLSMRLLSRLDSDEPIALCRRLAVEYSDWIDEQRQRIVPGEVPGELVGTAGSHIERCEECLRRIEGGIDLLARDRRVRRAFALMNRAMLMQQLHYKLASEQVRNWVREGSRLRPERPFMRPDYETAGGAWRPFQLAFILMNLASLADPQSPERAAVDVIWFPTGGGKTEAYLGLTAYTLFLRRLRNPANAGTAALMRYTLRLLTAQQYQRAASLICACEILRREDEDALGEEAFTIGLWVGSAVTPNREAEAVGALRRLLREGSDNPFVVLSCPWCGAAMGPVRIGNAYATPGYRLLRNPQRVRFVCEDPDCDFNDDDRGLPLLVIDEQMYEEPPSLLIGTVDKFALLPWYPDSSALFGLGTANAPPELIIQDELHLISGPLGSMVGHYETLIDALCRTEDGIPAKIVASTATISRAAEQVQALYARRALLFPPQGLEAGESFFAQERPDRPGRMYVGVFATGLPSQQTAMVRTLAALLQAPASLTDVDPSVIDPYWSLIAYFNSIRELGSAATLVSADIREYLGVTHERLGLTAAWGPDAAARRRFLNVRGSLELTGRVSSSAVTEALQQLFVRYEGRAAERSRSGRDQAGESGSVERRDPPVDVCLATNMIQVGLDVPRLGLMIVAGQPKTTSEYIQATSRVGRNTPGLVVTLYSPSKPRDRSHYEHFRAYHQSIYRYVEPTSVTPFAVPVRERALHALIVALARFWGDGTLRERPGDGPTPVLARRIREVLVDRTRMIDPDELPETEAMIDRLIAEWRRLPPSRYGDFAPPDSTVPFMYPSGTQPLPAWQDRALATPSSLRNVDSECDAMVLTNFPRD